MILLLLHSTTSIFLRIKYLPYGTTVLFDPYIFPSLTLYEPYYHNVHTYKPRHNPTDGHKRPLRLRLSEHISTRDFQG